MGKNFWLLGSFFNWNGHGPFVLQVALFWAPIDLYFFKTLRPRTEKSQPFNADNDLLIYTFEHDHLTSMNPTNTDKSSGSVVRKLEFEPELFLVMWPRQINLIKPLFCLSFSRDNIVSTHITECKYLAQCLAHSKYSINISSCKSILSTYSKLTLWETMRSKELKGETMTGIIFFKICIA